MKKIIALIITISIILLSGCASSKGIININTADTYVPNQDSDETFSSNTDAPFYANGETCYYFIGDNQKGSCFLYAVDKKSHKCYPLCNKSDCLHDREKSIDRIEKCNAYMKYAEQSLVYYNGYLYYQTYEEQFDKDGVLHTYTKLCRKSVTNNDTEAIYSTEDYGLFSFKIHRNYIYLKMLENKSNKDDELTDDFASIYRMPVDASENPKLIFDLSEVRKTYPNTYFTEPRYYGNHILINIMYTKNGKDIKTLINYDLTTKKWSDIGKNSNVKWDTYAIVFNNKLIFGSGTKLYECDFNGNNTKEVLNCNGTIPGCTQYIPSSSDGESLYITALKNDKCSNTFIICDKNYKTQIKKIDKKFMPSILQTGFDKNAFLYLYEDYEDESFKLYFAEKKDFSIKEIYNFKE